MFTLPKCRFSGLSISRNDIQDARQEIVDWVSGLDIAA